MAVSSAYSSLGLIRKPLWSVQKCPSSPVLRLLAGKAPAAWVSGAYGEVREHDQVVRTPLAAFFSTPFNLQPNVPPQNVVIVSGLACTLPTQIMLFHLINDGCNLFCVSLRRAEMPGALPFQKGEGVSAQSKYTVSSNDARICCSSSWETMVGVAI
ncbi:MAG: hypothetical protein R3B95_10545 [Nitrospirales bacterium]|nr:hypothetical protein [Nitrospirales bacterium]